MADDIVTRLRDVVCWCNEFDGVCDACQAANEIKRLRRWQSEATTVIENWEAVWEAAGQPGVLGQSKSLGLLGELGRLDDEIERLRAAGDALAKAVDDTWWPDYPCDFPDLLAAWQEARRG